jgi:hypothetical protein
LTEVYEIPETFTPCRYDGEDKKEFIDKYLKINRSNLDEWLIKLNNEYSTLKHITCKGIDYYCLL